MKKQLLHLVVALIPMLWMAQNAFSQNTSGTVKYEEIIKLNIQVEGMAADLAASLPKERRSQKSLVFNEDFSIYKNGESSDEEQVMSHGGATMSFKMAEPDNQLFYDIKKKSKVEQREFMTRQFLIEDKVNAADWKLTGNEKTILDYACQEAVREIDSVKTIAWFTPSIPVATGPGDNLALPGLVLEVIMQNGDRVITAKSIELGAIDQALIAKPKKGKKVTQDEFDQIVKEKMEEMGAQQGHASGTFIMRIER